MSNEEDDNAEDQDPAGVLDLQGGDNAAGGRADTNIIQINLVIPMLWAASVI